MSDAAEENRLFLQMIRERSEALWRVDTLEAKVKWQAEMLERAKSYAHGCAGEGELTAMQWLADLERGHE